MVAHGGAKGAGRWWLQAEGVAGGSLVWFGQREERGEESKRKREIFWNELMREKMNGEGFI